MSTIKKTDHFYLVDGSGYIFRAYYALPPLSRKSDGLPTGAVSGFCSMLFKLLEDVRSDDSENKPSHFAVIFDSARKNFRNEIYSEYKANRAEAPDDLAPQFEYIRKSVEAFNLPSIELLNYEADDLIATYSKKIIELNNLTNPDKIRVGQRLLLPGEDLKYRIITTNIENIDMAQNYCNSLLNLNFRCQILSQKD